MLKKFLIALVFALLPLAALAERPPCYPMVNGVHIAAPRHFVGEVGQHVYWFCSPRGGTPKAYGFSCLHGQCSQAALHAVHSTILAATAKVTAAHAAWDEQIQFNCPDVVKEETPRGELCRERLEVFRAMESRWVK